MAIKYGFHTWGRRGNLLAESQATGKSPLTSPGLGNSAPFTLPSHNTTSSPFQTPSSFPLSSSITSNRMLQNITSCNLSLAFEEVSSYDQALLEHRSSSHHKLPWMVQCRMWSVGKKTEPVKKQHSVKVLVQHLALYRGAHETPCTLQGCSCNTLHSTRVLVQHLALYKGAHVTPYIL